MKGLAWALRALLLSVHLGLLACLGEPCSERGSSLPCSDQEECADLGGGHGGQMMGLWDKFVPGTASGL